MKTWAPILAPFVLFVLTAVFFAAWPDGRDLPPGDVLLYLPHVLFGAAFVLGAIFTQTRISFLSLLLSLVTLILQHQLRQADPARTATVIFLSSIYLPPLAALLYRLPDRSVWTLDAVIRILVVLSAVAVIFLFTLADNLCQAVLNAGSSLIRPLSDFVRVPLLGLLAMAVSAPFLVVRKQHESPFTGRLMLLALLFAFAAFQARPLPDRPGTALTLCLAFMSGGALTLIGAILESLWRSANMDELTELPGRRMLKNHLSRLGPSYAIAVLDIDHFKHVNDQYGHDTGDQVLRFVASFLQHVAAGRAYRYGGEEFVIVCENEPFEQTVETLDRLRKALGARPFRIRRKDRPRKKPDPDRPPEPRRDERRVESIAITVSIGVARGGGDAIPPQDVLESADRALYRAKREGRNCVKVSR